MMTDKQETARVAGHQQRPEQTLLPCPQRLQKAPAGPHLDPACLPPDVEGQSPRFSACLGGTLSRSCRTRNSTPGRAAAGTKARSRGCPLSPLRTGEGSAYTEVSLLLLYQPPVTSSSPRKTMPTPALRHPRAPRRASRWTRDVSVLTHSFPPSLLICSALLRLKDRKFTFLPSLTFIRVYQVPTVRQSPHRAWASRADAVRS